MYITNLKLELSMGNLFSCVKNSLKFNPENKTAEDIVNNNMEHKTAEDIVNNNMEHKTAEDIVNNNTENKTAEDIVNNNTENKTAEDIVNNNADSKFEGNTVQEVVNNNLEGKIHQNEVINEKPTNKTFSIGNYLELKKMIENINKMIQSIPTALRLTTAVGIILQMELFGSDTGLEFKQIIAFNQTNPELMMSINKLKKAIELKDKKQVTHFGYLFDHKQKELEKLELLLKELLRYLPQFYHKQIFKDMKKINKNVLKKIALIHIIINKLRVFGFNFDFLLKIEPNVRRKKQTRFPSSFLDTEHDSDAKQITLHRKTRFNNCVISPDAAFYFVKKALKETDIFLDFNNGMIKICVRCPCIKSGGQQCESTIVLDDLKQFNSDSDALEIKKMIQLAKYALIETKYGSKISHNCPTPDCKNGNGFITANSISALEQCDFQALSDTIVQCPLCLVVWCSKCLKNHPNGSALCSREDDLKIEGIKKCPTCFTNTQHNNGCMHMTCPECNTHWCWTCNSKINNAGPSHHRCIVGTWVSGP